MIIEDVLFSEGAALSRLVKLYLDDGLVNVIPDVDIDLRFALVQLDNLNKLRRDILDDRQASKKTFELRTWGRDHFEFREQFVIQSVFIAYGRTYVVGKAGESLCVDSGINILQENNRLLESHPHSKHIKDGIDKIITYMEF